MRLQSDPTIVYGLVGGKGTLGRGILKSELDKATPYNTYIVEGLPPGPIANPGRAALEAVANPSRTKDLYFVADGTGGHAFAETLDQHLRNVTRWRQIEKEAKEKASAPANVDQVPAADIPTPAGSPPARDQRGQLLEPDPTFGALPRVIADSNAAVEAILAATGGAPVIRMESAPVIALDPRPNLLAFSGAKPAPPVRKGRGEAERPPLGTFANFNLGPGVENLTLAIASGPMAPALDGPIDAEENGAVDPAIVPMSAGRLSEMKARSAKFGPSGDDTLPLINEPIVSAYAPSELTGRTASGAARILDASEGTALDPLRNKSWDLNSAKTVPTGISAAVR
jgi:UPF0755 protein